MSRRGLKQAPKDCQELALLCCEYHTHCHRALELRPQTLIKLFKALDIYRRAERFETFLAVCRADAQGRTGREQSDYPQADYLRGAADAARNVSIQPLLDKGLQGADLGKALELSRQQAIADYKAALG